MDFEKVSPEDFGKSLDGIGVNLLVTDVERSVDFLTQVLSIKAHRVSNDFAIMTYGSHIFQLHADGTYATHPLLSLIPENPPRGGGVQLFLFNHDPDTAIKRAKEYGATIIETPRDKPHGLYEGTLLCPDGYAWSPSRPTVSQG